MLKYKVGDIVLYMRETKGGPEYFPAIVSSLHRNTVTISLIEKFKEKFLRGRWVIICRFRRSVVQSRNVCPIGFLAFPQSVNEAALSLKNRVLPILFNESSLSLHFRFSNEFHGAGVLKFINVPDYYHGFFDGRKKCQ